MPPARPTRFSAAQMAAELMGRVRMIPMATEMSSPIRKGCWVVAQRINDPRAEAPAPMGGARRAEASTPVTIVTAGVTIRSTGVRLETNFPKKMAISATK